MTKKRFKLNRIEQIGSTVVNITYDDDKTIFNLGDACTVLNELNDENEQLKKQIEELKVDLKMAKIDGAIDRMAQRPIRW